MSVLLLSVCVGNAWGADYSFVSSIPNGWTTSPSPNGYETSDLTRGAYWTSNFSLTFAGVSNVTQIEITYSTNNNQTGFSVTVGGNSWGGETQALSIGDRHATKTFSGSAISGDIVISCAHTNKTIYIEKVSITTSGGGTPTCATPTFSPAAGSYIGTQSVTISSTTTGSTIYYTTNGTTPTTSSNHGTVGAASATVSVSSNQTLKAYAVKDGANDSEVATATYTIISCSGDDFNWNLATNSYDADPTDELIKWTGTYATMQNSKGSGTNVTNYIPTSYSSTRFYNGNTLTITPASGVTISYVVFTATTTGYAGVLRNSTWTNATASGSDTYVIVTPTDGTIAFSATVGGTCGFTNVYVCYTAAACDDDPTVGTAQLKGSFSLSNFLCSRRF